DKKEAQNTLNMIERLLDHVHGRSKPENYTERRSYVDILKDRTDLADQMREEGGWSGLTSADKIIYHEISELMGTNAMPNREFREDRLVEMILDDPEIAYIVTHGVEVNAAPEGGDRETHYEEYRKR